jgi:hypothetical protein
MSAMIITLTLLAMSVTTESTIIARSADGNSTLAEVRAHGPEGGGSLAYRLRSAGQPQLEMEVSSDFGDGGSHKPQRISAGTCRERLLDLGRALAQRGFVGVATHPERCSASSRTGLVTVARTARGP